MTGNGCGSDREPVAVDHRLILAQQQVEPGFARQQLAIAASGATIAVLDLIAMAAQAASGHSPGMAYQVVLGLGLAGILGASANLLLLRLLTPHHVPATHETSQPKPTILIPQQNRTPPGEHSQNRR